MNVAVLLTGVSYGARSRDWRTTSASVYDKVIDCWGEHNVSVYLTTYNHPSIEELLGFYNPKKHLILDYDGSDQRITYAKSLELLEGEDIDLVVATRFDIDFHDKLSEYPIDYNKFNFLFREGNGWWESDRFTNDNLFIFPNKYRGAMVDVVYSLHSNPHRGQSDLHPLYSRLAPIINENNTNFLSEEHELSHNNTQYKLIRS
jgi:hypothetical protein